MIDERERLERAIEQFEMPEPSWDRLMDRRDRRRRHQRVAAGVVGIAVFAAAIWIMTSGVVFDRSRGGQQPATSGPTSPRVVPPVLTAPWVPKTLSREVGDVGFTFDVPGPGWERFDKISISKSSVGPQGAEAMVSWTSFPDDEFATACTSLRSPPVGPSVADLAAAVASAPGTELLAGPSDVTVGGRAGTYVAVTVRFGGCDPGFFYSWNRRYVGAFWPTTDAGDTISVWIVKVGGTRLFFEAQTKPEADAQLKKEIRQLVSSIRFDG